MSIPPGFNTVTPYFFVEGADAFIRFLVDGLGGVETGRAPRDDDHIANATVRLDTSTVMVSDAVGAFPAMSAAYDLDVENADAATDGDRQGGVRDPHGHVWWISQRTLEEPYRD